MLKRQIDSEAHMSLLPQPDVYIVILNWNRWKDTIECLESLSRANLTRCRVVAIDNGSTDDSVQRIVEWASARRQASLVKVGATVGKSLPPITVYHRECAENGGTQEAEAELLLLGDRLEIVVIKIDENLGFATGANVGIRYALARNARYVWLLNNDTVVKHGCLVPMKRALQEMPNVAAVTPQIRLYQNPDRIWNCGGRITWYGGTKYYFANCMASRVPNNGNREVGFATGCSLFVKAQILAEYGMLTEKFFFGEEDVEFAIRMRKNGFKMLCIFESVIYHKIGQSLDTACIETLVGKAFIHYLNRFINLKSYWRMSTWHVWRILYCIYIVPMLILRYKIRSALAIRFVRLLILRSASLEGVSKRTFQDAVEGGLSFFQLTSNR